MEKYFLTQGNIFFRITRRCSIFENISGIIAFSHVEIIAYAFL